MQRRVLAAAIAMLCVNTAVAGAQMMPLQDDPSWGPRIRITPFVGYLPAVTRQETWIHNDGSNNNTLVDVNYKLATGTAFGVTAEKQLRGPWNALVAVMYGSRGDSEFDMTSTGENFQINGSRYLFARAGGSFTLSEKETELSFRRMNASLYAAPFFMHEMPRSEIGFENANVFDSSNRFGISLGANGELPFAKDRMSLQLGIEDNATWWSSSSLSRLADAFFNDATAGSSTRVESDVSHMWMIRAGISIRR